MKVKTKSKKVNKAWLNDHVNDTYVKLAHKEGYRARAAYKLKEIDEALGLIRPGQLVVDLGAAPGAWSQYLRRRFAPREAGTGGAAAGALNGSIIALDLLPIEPIEGVQFIQGDFHDDAVLARLNELVAGRPVDVIVSDMAPNLSGIPASDSARIAGLVELAIAFAEAHLRPNGALVCKVFHGSGYSQLVELFKRRFRVVKPIKPKASRDKSSETFLVGIGLKKIADATEIGTGGEEYLSPAVANPIGRGA
ncbi:MAG: RlmE family RNA methyltransferase [Pseudomonadota bacterium]